MNENYINIGSVNACFFVKMSLFLLRRLEKKPLLYFAVEEALECANIGYYGIGILTFSQLLNLFNRKTPGARHIVAHEVLATRPTRETFDEIVEAFKEAARAHSDDEQRKQPDTSRYQRMVLNEWHSFMVRLHRIQE